MEEPDAAVSENRNIQRICSLHMKKTLLLLLALTSAAVAGEYGVTLLDVDFTKVSELPSGWEEGSYRNRDARFGFSAEKGATLVGSQDWEKRYMETQLSLSSQMSAQISFELYNSVGGAENTMRLTSSTGEYSIVIGNSYEDTDNDSTAENYVYSGLLHEDVSNKFISLGTYSAPDGVQTATIKRITKISAEACASYTLTFGEGTLFVNIVDANKNEWSAEYTIPEVTFDTIGFVVFSELEKNGVKSVSVRTVPEPATSVLSLLSLAGLAARRRRR